MHSGRHLPSSELKSQRGENRVGPALIFSPRRGTQIVLRAFTLILGTVIHAQPTPPLNTQLRVKIPSNGVLTFVSSEEYFLTRHAVINGH